ncbi:MAG TPA: glycoside hydrolase domain-containing protein [Chitinophagaceae bacterium]|nr:glycoside hydrolase domain-containing protein [Chitinophagaceae bacterium]
MDCIPIFNRQQTPKRFSLLVMKFFFLFIFGSLMAVPLFAQKVDTGYLSTRDAIRLYPKRVYNRHFLLFPISSGNPIKWPDSLRVDWLLDDYSNKPFTLYAHPGQYFVFQIGVWAIHHGIENLQAHFSDLKNGYGGVISTKETTCFNTGGINYLGRPFTKRVNVPLGQVQALWMGINLPATAKGTYEGNVTITAGNSSHVIKIQLEVNGRELINHGFDKGKSLSRLAWLNSTTGINNSITKGYSRVIRKRNTLKILGRSLMIAANGLPGNITTYFTPSNQSIAKSGQPIIDKPFHFIIEKANGTVIHLKPGKIAFTSQAPSFVEWKVTNTSDECDMLCKGRLDFDGFVAYQLTIKAKKPLQVKDIRMEVAMSKGRATYMMGLNKPGGLRPANWDWKWDTTKNQNDVWMGEVNGGLRIKWEAENYVLPLVNVYYTFGKLHLPPSWGNAGKGGVKIFEKGDDVMVNAYSGNRIMKMGEEQHYNFELLITPFKAMNRSVQIGARYYQSSKNVTAGFIHEADSLGANIITVHQGNDLYPFINYPYSDVNVKVLTDFISAAHQGHKRAKVYYTTRELTINLPEFWSFLSLNGEIIYPGPGAKAKTVTNPHGPDPWLLKNLKGRRYIPAWVSHFTKGRYAGMQDLSVITRPDSRLNNFYVAGLNWMVHNMKIDGIYIDDCSMDRTTIRRVRRILDDDRQHANIDMHSWNHFNKFGGWASCMNLYMDLFPYIDQLWIGEGRNYNTPPDYWLVEISGIPFGLPGQMLQGGGNPWRGMVYGMTNRAGWSGTPPDHIWRFWDQYHIKDKTMIGYWDPNNPVNVDDDSVKVTVYKGSEESILAVGNFGSTDQLCSLTIDFHKLGYDKAKCSFIIPEIQRYQHERQLTALDQLKVPGGEGYLIVVKRDR